MEACVIVIGSPCVTPPPHLSILLSHWLSLGLTMYSLLFDSGRVVQSVHLSRSGAAVTVHCVL